MGMFMDDKKFRAVCVTPDTAKDWLDGPTTNRNIRAEHVSNLARDMASGSWIWNGATICLNDRGGVLDGQHRLLAIIESGASVEMLVMFGVEDKAQKTIDGGRKRTTADMLKFMGLKNSVPLSSALVMLHAYRRAGIGGLVGRSHHPTNPEVEALYLKTPEIERSVSLVCTTYGCLSRLAPLSIWILLHYLLTSRDEEDAELFFDALATGDGVRASEPVFHLRKRLINDRMLQKRVPNFLVLALSVKTWNLYREGRECKGLRFKSGEKFPEVG